MTIKSIQEKTGLSRQTIYNRVKAAGHDMAAIKDAKTGVFTAEGEEIITELFFSAVKE